MSHFRKIIDIPAHDIKRLLAFAVERGPVQRIGSVSFEGLSRTSPKWATRVAAMSPGDVFRRTDLDAARADLFRSGSSGASEATSRRAPTAA